MKFEPLRLTPGTDLLLALAGLPRQRGERAGVVISGIGSLAPVRLRFAGRDGASTLPSDHEILSLAGSLSVDGAHLHLSVADADGRVTGGHLLEGSLVLTTAELLVAWLPDWRFRRGLDPQTGFQELQISRSEAVQLGAIDRMDQDSSQAPAQPAGASPAIALTIGGSDSGGGAGIQADLKTFTALKVHGCSALSCVTAQNTRGVSRVDALPPEALTAQIEAVLSDLPVAALKTGMLLNRGLIEAAARTLAPLPIPKLIDPVMVSRAGAVLLEPEAIQAYRDHLLPMADLLTPNLHEARLLSGLPIASAADVERAAAVLRNQGVAAVLVKGGGLAELRGCDYLLAGEEPGRWLVGAAIDTPHTHGSGCTLGAAITAHQARGLALADAVVAAKTYVEGGLRHALAIGRGPGPLCHWHPLL